MSDTRTWRSPLFWSSQKWNYAQNLTPYQNNLSLQPLETYFSSQWKVKRRPSSCLSSLNLPLYILQILFFFLNYFWILTEEGWGHSQARAGRMSHRRIFLGSVVWKFHFLRNSRAFQYFIYYGNLVTVRSIPLWTDFEIIIHNIMKLIWNNDLNLSRYSSNLFKSNWHFWNLIWISFQLLFYLGLIDYIPNVRI